MEQKSAFISILGRPNVGKSSLMNRILGQKVAIVSDKPQTTRTRIMGVHTENDVQLVFIDTPGFHKPRNVLGDNMIRAVNDGMKNVEAAILTVEAVTAFSRKDDGIPPAEEELIKRLRSRGLKALLVINKIDLLKNKEELFGIITAYTKLYDFESVIPLSAKTGDGVGILIDELKKLAVKSPHYFAEDDVTDQSEQTMVAEMIREKILLNLSSEVPHGVAVSIERFYERDTTDGEPILTVEADIFCEKESHKGIIIGKNGAMLKRIGTLARQDIEEFFGIRANIKLWVKTKENWRNRETLIRSFGLEDRK